VISIKDVLSRDLPFSDSIRLFDILPDSTTNESLFGKRAFNGLFIGGLNLNNIGN